MRRDTRPCLYCGKPKHIGHFCYKKKYKKHENEKDDDNYVFIMRNGTHSKSVCKWIMDSWATIHIPSHRAVFDTYEIIASHNVHLGDDSVVKALGMESIVMEVIVRGKINREQKKYALYIPKL